jgi:hypothetical protein
MLKQGTTLENGYKVIAIAGAYVMAGNGQQYATWWTYTRPDGVSVTVEGCYFLPRQCGGEAAAMAAALTNLTEREKKGRG